MQDVRRGGSSTQGLGAHGASRHFLCFRVMMCRSILDTLTFALQTSHVILSSVDILF